MVPVPPSGPASEIHRFAYDPPALVTGRGAAAAVGDELARVGSERALVVTGQTVGSTDAVMEPIRAGTGDRLVGEFAETTPDKRLETALAVAAHAREVDADALVAVGGGSSLDVAAFAAIALARDADDAALRDEFVAEGGLAVPAGDLCPLVAVPTTLAGADLSVVAGVTTVEDGDLVRGAAFDGRLMPAAVVYDDALFETTPHDVLCASAMNGFDKGVETLYSPDGSPVTDATAVRGLGLLRDGLTALGAGERDPATIHDCVVGTMLVQYGVSRADGPDDRVLTLSLIHAFGHGIARGYAVQQGGAHGIIAPHALSFLFDHVDGRRDLLATALGVDAPDDPGATAEAVIDAVAEVRDALGLPTRLSEVDDIAEDDLPHIAQVVHDDGFMASTPAGFDPSVADVESVLRDAW
ncbi:MAG: iron-containing alcohol dehydrogenase family protein [Haloarculaceae archaeon]